jgi:hypothetical protein
VSEVTNRFDPPLRATMHCRHYSYERGVLLHGPKCAQGIDLSAPGAGRMCWPEADVGQPCAVREEYTDAERIAWETYRDDRMIRLSMAVCALPRAIPMRSGGTVPCPNCDGTIRYGRWRGGAELNCSTAHCCGARFNLSGVDVWPSNEVGERAA